MVDPCYTLINIKLEIRLKTMEVGPQNSCIRQLKLVLLCAQNNYIKFVDLKLQSKRRFWLNGRYKEKGKRKKGLGNRKRSNRDERKKKGFGSFKRSSNEEKKRGFGRWKRNDRYKMSGKHIP